MGHVLRAKRTSRWLPPGFRRRAPSARARSREVTSGVGHEHKTVAEASRKCDVSQLAQVHATPGVAAYMAEVEAGLARAVAAQPGLAQEVAGEALSAGGKRLRPLLCFLTARDEPPVAAGVAVELVHMATLVHDDLVDGARL